MAETALVEASAISKWCFFHRSPFISSFWVKWKKYCNIDSRHSTAVQCTSLLTECFIDCCQLNLIDCDLMRYISWAASLRRRVEGQPFPLREQRAHPKWKGMVRNISIYWEWCRSLANGSSQLVFTVGADWAPSSLIALCVLTVCWGDSRQKVELRNTMRTHAMIGLSWTAVGALLSL